MVSAVVRRPAPLSLEDTLADIAVRRGIGRVLVLGRDVPQKCVLRGERDAALVAVRRRRVGASGHRRATRRLRRLYTNAFLDFYLSGGLPEEMLAARFRPLQDTVTRDRTDAYRGRCWQARPRDRSTLHTLTIENRCSFFKNFLSGTGRSLKMDRKNIKLAETHKYSHTVRNVSTRLLPLFIWKKPSDTDHPTYICSFLRNNVTQI